MFSSRLNTLAVATSLALSLLWALGAPSVSWAGETGWSSPDPSSGQSQPAYDDEEPSSGDEEEGPTRLE